MKKIESKAGGAGDGAEPSRRGRRSRTADKGALDVTITAGISAHEATRIPRDMFEPGPLGDYYFENQELFDFE